MFSTRINTGMIYYRHTENNLGVETGNGILKMIQVFMARYFESIILLHIWLIKQTEKITKRFSSFVTWIWSLFPIINYVVKMTEKWKLLEDIKVWSIIIAARILPIIF